MSKSILSNEKKCYVCGTTVNLHKHHIYFGAFRPISEKYGCWCYLCGRHHNQSNDGVHFNRELDLQLKRKAQEKFSKNYDIDFISIFHKNYL